MPAADGATEENGTGDAISDGAHAHGVRNPHKSTGLQDAGHVGEPAMVAVPAGISSALPVQQDLVLPSHRGNAGQDDPPWQRGFAAGDGYVLGAGSAGHAVGTEAGVGLHSVNMEQSRREQGAQIDLRSDGGGLEKMQRVALGNGIAESPGTGFPSTVEAEPGDGASAGGFAAIETITRSNDADMSHAGPVDVLPWASPADKPTELPLNPPIAIADQLDADSDSIPDIDSGSDSE